MKAHGFRLTRKKDQRPQINLQQQIKAPQKLKLLVLSGSRLSTHDFLFILKCRSIIKLDLSDNELTSIPAQFNAQVLPSLKLLYLHNNYLRQLEDIKPVVSCQHLIHITIFNNPIQSSQIQHYFINILPSLKMINDRVVMEQQKADSLIINRQSKKIALEQLGMLGSNEFDDEIAMPQQKKHILRLQRQLHLIKKLWVENNPIVKLQRRWRRHHQQLIKTNKQLQEQTNQNSNYRQLRKLKYFFDKWKTQFQSIRTIKQRLAWKDKSYLSQTMAEYCRNIRLQKTKKAMVYCIKKLNKENRERKYAKSVIDRLRKKVTIFNSEDDFYAVSGIAQTHRILFFKNQLSTFTDLLQKCNDCLSRMCFPEYDILPCSDYITIRPAQDCRPHNNSLYSYFISPSMRCIFLKRKQISNGFIPKQAKNLVEIRQVPYLQRLCLKMSEDEHLQSYVAYENISKYIQSQYHNSLLQFVCHDHQYFKKLLRIIYYTNVDILTKESRTPSQLFDDGTSFRFYFDKQLRRTTAAVGIQKWWRGVRVIKKQKVPPQTVITYNRSATLIKHFYRGLEYEHRMAFNRKLDRYLKSLTDNTLIIEEDIYMEISKLKVGKHLYPGSKIMVGQKYIRISWNYDLQVLSPYIRTIIQRQPEKRDQNQREGDLYSLLHLDASVSLLKVRGVKYIKFTYHNYLIARRRIAYFSLLTYCFKNNGFYIKCYQKLSLDRDKIIEYYLALKSLYRVYIGRSADMSDEEKALKMTDSVFIFPRRSVQSNSNKQEILRNSLKLQIQFYHKTNKTSPPIKLLEKLFINLNQFRPQGRSKSTQKYVTPSPDAQQRRKYSLPRPQFSMQQLNFASQQVTIEPQVNKEEILVKLQSPSSNNQISVKKDYIFSRRKMLLEHKQTAIKKFRKQKTQFSQKNEQVKLETQMRQQKKIENQYLENKKRDQSLKEMKKHANQFIQKGNSLIKQDVMTSLIRSNIENRISKREKVYTQKGQYESSLQKRKKYNSQHSQSYISDNQVQKKEVRKNHPRYRTEIIVEKKREISLPRLSEDNKNTAPPMVHGVFTEEFYAIDKKVDPSAMFNF